MQQQFMQMQPMMAADHNPNTLTTDQIQLYLDENRYLIMKILEDQNNGKVSQPAELARLQQNLTYLESIAGTDTLQQPTMNAQIPNSVQQSANYMQHQQAQVRSMWFHNQMQPMPAVQQQQAVHSQLGMNFGGNNYGLPMMHSEGSMGGGNYGSMGSVHPDLSGVRRYRNDPHTSTLKQFWNWESLVYTKNLGETNVSSLKDSKSGETVKPPEKPVRSRGAKRKKTC